MTPLLTGIYTLFAAGNTFNTAMGGRLYHAEAPQGATFPYCVVTSISDDYYWTFSDTFESVLVQFAIFTNESSAANIGAHWAKLKALYDGASLAITGYSLVSMIRGQSRLLRNTEDNIWQYVVEYECFLEQA